MRKLLADWLDQRTGYRRLIEVLLIEHIPGGAKWRYVWGSCLAFVFLVQLLTGVLLMTAYSPGNSTAWASVYFIQYEMDFGWFVRGLHHFGSQAMVVLLGVHMLQVVIAGAHLPPREINWWLGLALLSVVLGLSLTGYLLPWDQKGYWATQVATYIAGNLPWIGPWVQKIVVGGPVYGHHTLTRFFALHVGILPPLAIVLIIAHLVVFRRHGVTVSRIALPLGAQGKVATDKEGGWFWPDQAFRDLVASMLIFGVLLSLVLWGHGHKIDLAAPVQSAASVSDAAANEPSLYQRWAQAGRAGKGANLDAPADPATGQYPARPEWYFLFLFQLLKYFEGEREIIATVFIPLGVGALLALLPLLGYGRMRPFGHFFGVLVVVGILAGAALLTYLAIDADRRNEDFRNKQEEADQLAKRAVQLADAGIPEEGAIYLLRRDPLTQGTKRFEENCASCHNHGKEFHSAKATASDLAAFGTEEWIGGLLHDAATARYFGHTKLRTMSNWVRARWAEAAKDQARAQKLRADFNRIAGWLAVHPGRDKIQDEKKPGFAEGLKTFENRKCLTCHTFQSEGEAKGPDLTGYGDADWLRVMLLMPYHGARYGSRNRMPAFRDLESSATADTVRQEVRLGKELLLKDLGDDPEAEKKAREATRVVQLSAIDRELIIRWLLKDYRVVFGGEPIAAAPPR